jgi:predicted DNA-binding transcriptional regulator AlpA
MTYLEFLSAQMLAKRYQVSISTMWRWAQCNQIPRPIKINGTTRWKLSEIIKWENEKVLTN